MVEWLYRPKWLKAPAATHVEWNCAMMAVWVHLSDILSWLPLFKYYSQPLMSHFFVLHTSNDPNDLIEGYGYAWRSTVLVFVVGPRRERRVPELSFNKRPQFMYICSPRGSRLLLKWSFKSLQVLGSSELRGIPLTHKPFQHQTIASSESMA